MASNVNPYFERVGNKENRKVVGIDLSLTATGLVILNVDGEVIRAEVFKSKPMGKTNLDEVQRICDIRNRVIAAVRALGPHLVANIEAPAFMARNTTSLVQLGALSFMVREALMLYSIKFVMTAPTSLKKFATGKGNADKNMVLMEVYKRWKYEAKDDNDGDAFALAKLMWHVLYGDPETTLIKPQEEVVELIKQQL